MACVAATLLARARQARRKMALVRFPDGGEALCADGDHDLDEMLRAEATRLMGVEHRAHWTLLSCGLAVGVGRVVLEADR